MQTAGADSIVETVHRVRTPRGRLPDGTPNPVDVYVGRRVHVRRRALGLSQEQLAVELGLSFQQIQKYERGANRISASRLWELSKILNCPIGFFFKDMDELTAGRSPRNLGDTRASEPEHTDNADHRETMELMEVFERIPEASVRRRIFGLAKSLAETDRTRS